jgi:hypothetical protein
MILYGKAIITTPDGLAVIYAAESTVDDAQIAQFSGGEKWAMEPHMAPNGHAQGYAVLRTLEVEVTISPVGSAATNTRAHALASMRLLTPLMVVTLSGFETYGATGATWSLNKKYNLMEASNVEGATDGKPLTRVLRLKREIVSDTEATNDAWVDMLATKQS